MPEMVGAIQREDVDRASELQIRIWLDGEFRDPGPVDAELREKALKMDHIPVMQGTFFRADTRPFDPLDPPDVTRLEEVRCPTLIIAGSLDHPEVLHTADEMAARIPRARKVIFEGNGHVPSYEQPDQFIRQLLEFYRLRIDVLWGTSDCLIMMSCGAAQSGKP